MRGAIIPPPIRLHGVVLLKITESFPFPSLGPTVTAKPTTTRSGIRSGDPKMHEA